MEAEALGFEHDEALTLGLLRPGPMEVKDLRRKMRKEETVTIDLLHRAVPVSNSLVSH